MGVQCGAFTVKPACQTIWHSMPICLHVCCRRLLSTGDSGRNGEKRALTIREFRLEGVREGPRLIPVITVCHHALLRFVCRQRYQWDFPARLVHEVARQPNWLPILICQASHLPYPMGSAAAKFHKCHTNDWPNLRKLVLQIERYNSSVIDRLERIPIGCDRVFSGAVMGQACEN
jgi:hypothetical protein